MAQYQAIKSLRGANLRLALPPSKHQFCFMTFRFSDMVLMDPDKLATYFQGVTQLCGLVESVRRFETSGAVFVSVTPEAFLAALNRPLDPEILAKLRSIQGLIHRELEDQTPPLLKNIRKGVVLGYSYVEGAKPPGLSQISSSSNCNAEDGVLSEDMSEEAAPSSLKLYDISVLDGCTSIVLQVPSSMVSASVATGLDAPVAVVATVSRGTIVDVVLKEDCPMTGTLTIDKVKLVIPHTSPWASAINGILSVFNKLLCSKQNTASFSLFPPSNVPLTQAAPYLVQHSGLSQDFKDSFTRNLSTDNFHTPEQTSQEHTFYFEQAAFKSIDEDGILYSGSHEGSHNTHADSRDNHRPIAASSLAEHDSFSPCADPPQPIFFGNISFPPEIIGNFNPTTEPYAMPAPIAEGYGPMLFPNYPGPVSKSLSNLSHPTDIFHIVTPSLFSNLHQNNKLFSDVMQRFNALLGMYTPMTVMPLSTRFRGRIEFIQDGYGCIVCPPIAQQGQTMPAFMNPNFIASANQMDCAGLCKVFQSLSSMPQDIYNTLQYASPTVAALTSFNIADGIFVCCFFSTACLQNAALTGGIRDAKDNPSNTFLRGDIVEFNIVHGYGYACDNGTYGTATQQFYPLLSPSLLKRTHKSNTGSGKSKKSDDTRMKHSASAPAVTDTLLGKFNYVDLEDYYSVNHTSSSPVSYITLLADNISVLKNTRTTKSQWHNLLVDGHLYQGIIYTFNETENYGFIKSYGNRAQAGTLSQGIEVYFRPTASLGAWKPERGCVVMFKAKWVDSKAQAREVRPIFSRSSSFLFGQCIGVFPPFAIIRAVAHLEHKCNGSKCPFSGPTVDFLQCRGLLAKIDSEAYVYGDRTPASYYGGIDPYWASDLYFVRTKTLAQALKVSLGVGSYVGFNVDPDISTHLRAINLSVIEYGIFVEILAYLLHYTPSSVIPSFHIKTPTVQAIEQRLPWSSYFKAPTKIEPIPLRAFTFHLELSALQATFQHGIIQNTNLLHVYHIGLTSKYDSQTVTVSMSSVLRPLETAVTASQCALVCTGIDATNIIPTQLYELGYPNLVSPGSPMQYATISIALFVNAFRTCYAMQVAYVTNEYVILNSLTIKYDAHAGKECVEPNLFYIGIPRSLFPLRCMSFGMAVYVTILCSKAEQLVNGLVLGKLLTVKGYVLVVLILPTVKVEVAAPLSMSQ